MSLQFKRDPRKAKVNLAKHGVWFEEAMTVFGDLLARIFDDEEHSEDEKQEIIIGHSIQQHLVLVSFTCVEDTIRLLSARKAPGAQRL